MCPLPGFHHSAYTFGIESHISQSNINGAMVPSAALLTMLQKGLKYTEAEISVDEDGILHRLAEGLTLIDAVMPDLVEQKTNALNAQKHAQVKTESGTATNTATSGSTPAGERTPHGGCGGISAKACQTCFAFYTISHSINNIN